MQYPPSPCQLSQQMYPPLTPIFGHVLLWNLVKGINCVLATVTSVTPVKHHPSALSVMDDMQQTLKAYPSSVRIIPSQFVPFTTGTKVPSIPTSITPYILPKRPTVLRILNLTSGDIHFIKWLLCIYDSYSQVNGLRSPSERLKSSHE